MKPLQISRSKPQQAYTIQLPTCTMYEKILGKH